MAEARAKDLLLQPLAWPLGKRLHSRQRLARALLPLDRRQRRIDTFCIVRQHAFVPDRLTPWLLGHAQFKETYARGFRVKSDQELPSGVLEAVQHEHMPQFNLRNIGRAERDVELDDPLPLQRERGLGGNLGAELREVREARAPRPQLAEIWSVALVKRVRASFRRILLEDPWELRLGPEATSGHDGRAHGFIAEGTHPDDLASAWWGPEPVPMPEVRAGPPDDPSDTSLPVDLAATMRELTRS